MSTRHLVALLLALALAVQLACAMNMGKGGMKASPEANGRQAALGEEFKLLPHEWVAIENAGLNIRVDKVLRSWYTDGRSETVSVEFTTTLNDKEEKQYLDFEKKTAAVGEFDVELLAADPFGKNECRFKVTRRER